MQLRDARILLTGASGGIGEALAEELVHAGARLCLVGRNAPQLNALKTRFAEAGHPVEIIIADLSRREGIESVREATRRIMGRVDILINNAGVSEFVDFADQASEKLEQIFRVNVLAPMQLTQALLPSMLEIGDGQIVNIGSTFGSIGFACFTSYSASKFALRGFSEALRRELDGSGINVTYIAPRAVKTQANSPAVYRMAEAVKMNMDEPERIARKIARAIEKDRKDVYFGFPEALFVRINALLPRLVDKALRKQNQVMRDYTRTI